MIEVFVTHKTDHRAIAEAVIDILKPYGSDRLNFKHSEEMPIGARWRDWIRDTVSGAHLLFFIAPKRNVDWVWPIYEAGLFEGSGNNEQNEKRIILLHNPAVNIPDPLQELQVVKAELNDTKNFLKKFFGTDEITGEAPLNIAFSQNENLVEQTAISICNLFREIGPEPDTNYVVAHMAINIANPENIEDIPNASTIEFHNDAQAIFGLASHLRPRKSTLTWLDFIQELGSSHEKWLKELVRAICDSNKGRKLSPLRITCRAMDNKIYTPILYQMDDNDDGSRKFHIVFNRQLTEGMFVKVPDKFATLLTNLTLGSRLEWEVCKEYVDKIKRWEYDVGEKKIGCKQIRVAISNIEGEAEYRKRELSKQIRPDRLFDTFDSEEEISAIDNNLKEQQKLKDFLSNADENTDIKMIKESLEKLDELNREVMLKISDRYNTLLKGKKRT
jgi:hypothetical protein